MCARCKEPVMKTILAPKKQWLLQYRLILPTQIHKTSFKFINLGPQPRLPNSSLLALREKVKDEGPTNDYFTASELTLCMRGLPLSRQ